MRAYVSPHRVLKVRLESDPTHELRIEIGRIVPCETCGHGALLHLSKRRCIEPGCECKAYVGHRDYDASDLVIAVDSLVDSLERNHVTVAEIIEPPHNYADGQEIARVVMMAIADAGIQIDAPWREKTSGTGIVRTDGPSPDRKEGVDQPRPHVADCDTLADRGPEESALDSGVAPCNRAQGAKASALPEAPAPRDPWASASSPGIPSPTVDDDLIEEDARRIHAVIDSASSRIAGIDPGTARIAVVVATDNIKLHRSSAAWHGDPLPPPVQFTASRVFEIGHIERSRGRNRHVFTDADIDAVLPQIAAFLRAHGVTRVAVESSNGGMFNNAAEATRANHIAGEIAGYLRANGMARSRVSESTWYHAIVKGARRKRFRADPRLLAALQAGYGGTWPEVTNEDVRDAGGIVLAMLSPPTPKKKKAPAARIVPKKKAHENRTKKRAAARAASGCTCKGRGSHALSCPARKK